MFLKPSPIPVELKGQQLSFWPATSNYYAIKPTKEKFQNLVSFVVEILKRKSAGFAPRSLHSSRYSLV